MEGATPTFDEVVNARSNHSVQTSSMLSRMSWRSRVYYTLAGIKSLLKIGGGGIPWRERGVPEPLELSPGYAPVSSITSQCLRKDPVRTCTPDSRTREINGNEA